MPGRDKREEVDLFVNWNRLEKQCFTTKKVHEDKIFSINLGSIYCFL